MTAASQEAVAAPGGVGPETAKIKQECASSSDSRDVTPGTSPGSSAMTSPSHNGIEEEEQQQQQQKENAPKFTADTTATPAIKNEIAANRARTKNSTASTEQNILNTNSAVVVDESHSQLSSYIKRSLSGLFSDVARAAAEQEDVPIRGAQDQAVDNQAISSPPLAPQDDTAPPVRKRSRLDLELQGDDESTLLDPNPVARHDGPQMPASTRRMMSRRRSFSYQCLNKLFNIDNDEEAGGDHIMSDDDKLTSTRQSPRTVTRPTSVASSTQSRSTIPDHNNNDSQQDSLRPDHEAPFDLPQPSLEESDSMIDFIQVMGAVDNLDLVEHCVGGDGDDNQQQDDDGMVDVANIVEAAAAAVTSEEDTFGWYISDEEEKAQGNGDQQSSFLPGPQPTTPSTQKHHYDKLLQPAKEENDTAALEYARVADTVDNVLGDFFG